MSTENNSTTATGDPKQRINPSGDDLQHGLRKKRATRTPRNAETITKGALELTLAEKVKLRNDLNDAIKNEVANAEKAANDAKNIAGV